MSQTAQKKSRFVAMIKQLDCYLATRFPPIVIVIFASLFSLIGSRILPNYSFVWLQQFAVVVFALATMLIVLSAWQFKRFNTTIDPRIPEQTAQLLQTGVFGFSRNPIYVGFVLYVVAVNLWLGLGGQNLLIIAVIGYLQRWQIKPEERMLELHFTQQYKQYCANVRRWL